MRQLSGAANPGCRRLSGGVGTRWKARPQARLPAPRLTIRRRAEMVQDSSVSNREFPDERLEIGDERRSCETILRHEAALGVDKGSAGARAGPVAGALDEIGRAS